MRVAEEDEVRHVDVEPGDKPVDEPVPLPHGVGSDPVEEEESGLGVDVSQRDPAVDDGAVSKIGG